MAGGEDHTGEKSGECHFLKVLRTPVRDKKKLSRPRKLGCCSAPFKGGLQLGLGRHAMPSAHCAVAGREPEGLLMSLATAVPARGGSPAAGPPSSREELNARAGHQSKNQRTTGPGKTRKQQGEAKSCRQTGSSNPPTKTNQRMPDCSSWQSPDYCTCSDSTCVLWFVPPLFPSPTLFSSPFVTHHSRPHLPKRSNLKNELTVIYKIPLRQLTGACRGNTFCSLASCCSSLPPRVLF